MQFYICFADSLKMLLLQKSFKLKNKYRQRDTTKIKTKKGNVKNITVNKCSLLL